MKLSTKKFKKWKISYVNEAELDEMLSELYAKKYYLFSTTKKSPVIFDVGALIGETALFFKDQYPGAKITAFEPSPRSFKLLKKNVSQNNIKNIRLINAAVAGKSGKMDFYIDRDPNNPWGRGDTLKKTNLLSSQTAIRVPAVRLSKYIKSEIDLLKLDIEGAETEVIQEIEPKLKYIRNLILEFHYSIYTPENSFQTIMTILKKHGFTLKVYLSRWVLPNLFVQPVLLVLSIMQVKQYWLRIYAQRSF